MDIHGVTFEPWMNKLVDDLIDEEGFRAKLYDDATGKPPAKTWKGNLTIGFGWNIEDTGITKDFALFRLRYTVSHKILELETRFWFWARLSPNRKRGMANLLFNMGWGKSHEGGLLSFVNALQAMQDERYSEAADEFLSPLYVSQVGPTRSKFVTDLIRHG